MKANAMQRLVLIVLALVMPLAMGQTESRRPSADEIVKRLTLPEEEPQAKVFGMKGITVEGRRPAAPEAPSIDLEVNFEYASANLTADARLVLDNLGKALGDPALRSSRFLVAGHTDAAGTDTYNLALSARRAQVVADYLVRVHGVESARLTVVGYGKSKLLDTANPLSAINRRVQVANLGE